MVWLKVDDGFYSHAKVTAIPKAQRAEAVGTWLVCGAWCADKRTDGVIPAHQVEELGGTPGGAEALVAVKLWKRVRGGFAFVNWGEWQPTRTQLDERTRIEREKKRAQRKQPEDETPDGPGNPIRGTSVVSPGGPTLPVPSRPGPDPTPTDFLRQSVGAPVENAGEKDGLTDDESLDGAESNRWAGYLGVDLERIRRELGKRLGRIVPGPVALRIVSEVLDRAPQKPGKPTGYVLTSIREDWAEWERFVAREEEGGAA